MQATAVWIDQRHAQIALAYGCYTMHIETAMAIEAFNRNPHLIKLFAVGEQVLGFLKYKVKPQLGYAGEHFKEEEGLEVKIKVLGGASNKPKYANCS